MLACCYTHWSWNVQNSLLTYLSYNQLEWAKKIKKIYFRCEDNEIAVRFPRLQFYFVIAGTLTVKINSWYEIQQNRTWFILVLVKHNKICVRVWVCMNLITSALSGWCSVNALASHHCYPGSIPGVAMLDGHVATKSGRWVSSGHSGFLPHEEHPNTNIGANEHD